MLPRLALSFSLLFLLFTGSSALGAGAHCTLPGVTVVEDPSNDTTTGRSTEDIQRVSISELYNSQDTANKVDFTLKLATAGPSTAFSTRFVVFFKRSYAPDATEWFVAMRIDSFTFTPSFHYGRTTATGDLVVEGTADSGTYQADGTITIALSKPTRANPNTPAFTPFSAGETLNGIRAATQNEGATFITSDSTSSGTYTLLGNGTCFSANPSPTPTPSPSPGATPTATIPLAVNQLAADPVRPRVYGTVPSTNSVIVIDTTSLSIIKTIPIGSTPRGLSVSADGSKLWVANSGSTAEGIGVVDLESLTALPSIGAPGKPFDIEEGLSGRLYVTVTGQYSTRIAQVNSQTGQFERYVGEYPNDSAYYLETAPDRKTLFAATSQSYNLLKFDISSTKAKLLQQVPLSGGNEGGLSISPSGQFIVMPSGAGNGSGYSTYSIPTADIKTVQGSFVTGAYPSPATWSNDSTLLYHSVASQDVVKVFDTKTFALVNYFRFGDNSGPFLEINDIKVDRSGQWVFMATGNYTDSGVLRIFSTGRTDPLQPRPAPGAITEGARSMNISTRVNVLGGQNVLIAGFIITGNTPKKVIVRAIGPSVGVNGAMSDPTLELHQGDGSIITNDNWKVDDASGQPQEEAIRATGIPPSDDRESALLQTLAPGVYTAVVAGKNGGTGVGLVEVYDAETGSNSRLANISTRGYVATGDNVLIGGFITGPAGSADAEVVVRALGPSLEVSDPLLDPVLELYNANGAKVATNDNYFEDQRTTQLDQYGLKPKDGRESALVRTLAPGAYTAIVRGKSNTTGVGLVEVYNLQ